LEKLGLIELIERETARLTPRGRELWEELEFLRESDPDEEDRAAHEYEIMERIFELPAEEQFATSRLAELVAGLRASEKAEHRGEQGEEHRARAVIRAAWLKDREEGHPVDPDMTLELALVRLNDRD
jgi:hypothetical protein